MISAVLLRDDDILVTKSFTPELCSIDTVSLVDRISRFPSGFALLSEFVPYTKAQADRLRDPPIGHFCSRACAVCP